MSHEISAWDTTEPLNTGTILPPVNPWDVVPSEPVESTGWANFENFENTLSIENTGSEDKKPCEELKEKIPEATAIKLTKDMTCNISEKSLNIEDNDEKNKDYVDSQVVGTELPSELPSVAETNLNDSKSDEHKMISVNEPANPSELLIDRYLYSIYRIYIIIQFVRNLYVVSSRDPKSVAEIETAEDTKNIEDEKPSIEEHQVPSASSESTSVDTAAPSVPQTQDAK